MLTAADRLRDRLDAFDRGVCDEKRFRRAGIEATNPRPGEDGGKLRPALGRFIRHPSRGYALIAAHRLQRLTLPQPVAYLRSDGIGIQRRLAVPPGLNVQLADDGDLSGCFPTRCVDSKRLRPRSQNSGEASTEQRQRPYQSGVADNGLHYPTVSRATPSSLASIA
jgi:hypothetical protein